jgi:hypothetical protein
MTKVTKKKKPGRPATGTDPIIAARMPKPLIKEIDAWANGRGIKRSDALRQLVELALSKSP